MKVAVTGVGGLLGWHASVRLHAYNCAASFEGKDIPFELVRLDRESFSNAASIAKKLAAVDAILHFAGVNRGESDEVEKANPSIAKTLVQGCKDADVNPYILYANSTHSGRHTPYGRSKRVAGEILEDFAENYCNLVLPHIFGENAKPYYNNVTATLIDQIHSNALPVINPDGEVSLLYAGDAVHMATNLALEKRVGTIQPNGQKISVPSLYEKLKYFHSLYRENIFPNLAEKIDLNLFNCYRSAAFPTNQPIKIKLNKDDRGVLFEAAKGGGPDGQSFMSTTAPGITRGDHFHCEKVERFLVVRGKAIIRLRRVLTDELYEFQVNGDEPVAIDIPPLYTHSIENIGNDDLYTLFWAHEMFDPNNPDTYAHSVLQ